ncbi:MAG: hypothetical protein Q8M83_03770 [bacterium]|nr:hypothetical protein [bacterium]
MRKQSEFILSLIFLFILSPVITKADTTKTFTESFSSTSKIEVSNTYAFINTKNQEVTLPWRYAAQNMAKGLQNFSKTRVTALATDGIQVMAGGANGSLSTLQENGITEDITGLLNNKAKSIAAIDYVQESGWWLVGGEAKQKKDGALLFKLVPGGLKTTDLQADAKDIKMEAVNAISCLSATCLVAGTPRKLALYNGIDLQDLNADQFNLIDPVSIANNGVAWLLVGVKKGSTQAGEKSYAPTVYLFDGQNFQSIPLPDNQLSSMSSLLDIGWNGQSWLIVRSRPFTVWQVNGTLAQDVTADFIKDATKVSLSPVIGTDNNLWFIGGGAQWRGLLVKKQAVAEDISSSISELKNANILATLPSPWQGGVLLGGYSSSGVLLLKLSLEDYTASAALESKSVASAGGKQSFKTAKLSAEMELPAATGIDFMLASRENGWESFTPGQEKEFIKKGSSLKWRAVLYTSNPLVTPRLKKLSITYTTETPLTQSQTNSQDSTRISNVRQVTAYLKTFKNKYGAYPIVEALNAADRWQQLEDLLKNSKIITASLPNDPRKSEDINRQYDYLIQSGGAQYLLLTRLENSDNKSLSSDLDGAPLQTSASYSCDDPFYCQGDVTISTSPPPTPPSPPLPQGKVEIQLVRDPAGQVWHITDNKKVAMSSPNLVSQLGYALTSLKKVSQDWLNKYTRANLIKATDSSDIFYLNSRNEKRHIPTWQAFVDYGFKLTNVASVTSQEIVAYTDANLVKLKNDNKIWKLDGNVKRYIPSPEIFKAYGFSWNKIDTINWSEYIAYPEGAALK